MDRTQTVDEGFVNNDVQCQNIAERLLVYRERFCGPSSGSLRIDHVSEHLGMK
jgi:hypothetical protein